MPENCGGAKCDGLDDPGQPLLVPCYSSSSSNARRCPEPGIEGLSTLIAEGFDPVVALSCEEVNAFDASDPADHDAILKHVVPVCDYLPHCLFKESADSCIPAWELVGEATPSVQCDLIESAEISDAAKAAYCALSPCPDGNCGTSCTAVHDQVKGKVHCVANSAASLVELASAGESPAVPQTCGEIDAMASELSATMDPFDATVAMRSICELAPHCLFKESGGFCMPVWQIVGTLEPAEQCASIDAAAFTEEAKAAYCNLPVESACNGNDCQACAWIESDSGGPGVCAAL
jgi:hypothetical protein